MKFTYPFGSTTIGDIRRALMDDGFFGGLTSSGRRRSFAFVERSPSDYSTSIIIPKLKGRLIIRVEGFHLLGMRFEAIDGQFTHEKLFHFFSSADFNIVSIVIEFLDEAKAARKSA